MHPLGPASLHLPLRRMSSESDAGSDLQLVAETAQDPNEEEDKKKGERESGLVGRKLSENVWGLVKKFPSFSGRNVFSAFFLQLPQYFYTDMLHVLLLTELCLLLLWKGFYRAIQIPC